jgi:hypothetical protein
MLMSLSSLKRPLTMSVLLLSLVLGGCGGGSDDGGSQANGTVTLTYPSGRVMAVGQYLPGTTTRTGEWMEYFDQAGSPPQWRRSFTDNAWDQAKDWREWNADGSVRNDAGDR